MPSIQVKGVPDDVHATLRRRAAAAGQSLQEHLLAHLVEEARTPTLEEVLERAGGRSGGGVGSRSAVEAIRAERDSRRSSLTPASWSPRWPTVPTATEREVASSENAWLRLT